MSIKDMLGKVGSRKLAVTIIVMICGTLVDILSKNGLSTNLSNLLMALAGVFAVGNGMEHISKKGEAKAQTIDLSSLEAKTKATNESLTAVLNTLSFIIRATGLDKPSQVQQQQQSVPQNRAAANRAAVANQGVANEEYNQELSGIE